MLRLVGLLVAVAAVSLLEIVRAWLLVKPFKRWKAHRAKKREAHVGDNDDGQFFTDDKEQPMAWLQSRTIQGLLASGAAWALALYVGDVDAPGLSAQVTHWLLEGVQLGGLIYAARGRKLAAGPL